MMLSKKEPVASRASHERFDALGRLFELSELPVRTGPACFAVAVPRKLLTDAAGFPPAALPGSGRIAAGRGIGADECRRSCLGEAAELVSCCLWGDEALISAPDGDMGPDALLPEALNGFTRNQIANRAQWNSGKPGFDWRPGRRSRGTAIDWVPVDDAFGAGRAFAPADFVFIGRREAGDEDAVAVADSNGCAAAAVADVARLAAVLELVERDATGRWWYGRRCRPPLDLSDIEGATDLVAFLRDRERGTVLFDITSDVAIPVIAAVSAEPDGRDVSLGFAARLDVHSAAASALTEMLQLELSLAAARSIGAAAESWHYWRKTVRMTTSPLDAAFLAHAPPPRMDLTSAAGCTGLSAALDACAAAGVDLWFADLTRTAIGVPVFRALSTTLCHYKPRFGRRRLLAPDDGDLDRVSGSPRLRPALRI